MPELVGDGSVRLIVSTMGRDHSEANIESLSLEALSDALCDLYTRMGCEACDREATAVLERGGTVYRLYSEDPDEAPEQVAVELWEKIVALG